jgi:hypothetical protein
MRSPGALLVSIVLAIASRASADDRDMEHVSRAPTLPDLQHHGVKSAVDTSIAAFSNGGGAVVERLSAEIPLGGRAWQLGAAWSIGTAKRAGQGSATIGGNTELWARGEWVEAQGLAFGGGLGVALPTAVHAAAGPGADASRALVTMRPWDATVFEPRILALRPFVDMRLVAGRAALQLRHGVDFGVRAPEGIRANVVGLIGLAATLRFGRFIPGIEAWELYVIEREPSDVARAFFTVAPFLCGVYRGLEPCVSVLTNVSRAVSPDVDVAIGPRFTAAFDWE